MIKAITKTILALLAAIMFMAAFIWFKPLPEFPHHEPRNLPWALPDYTQASSQINVLKDGRLHITIEHLPLLNIEPKMVSLFYRVLPISTVQLNGEAIPLYHIFHPTEHGYIEVKEPAPSGINGMTEGALVSRKEWFGPYNSKGAGRIIKMNDTTMIAQPEMLGLTFGRIVHTFEAMDYGTRYTVNSIIGSDLPIIGPLINYYIRHKKFKPQMLKQWLRHQVQEVSSLQFFAKPLYEMASPVIAKNQAHYHFDLGLSAKSHTQPLNSLIKPSH